MTDAKSEAFGVRLDAPTLARLDAFAERNDRKRGAAAVRAIVAGLDALEGAPGAPGPVSLDPAPLNVNALAAALCDRLGPMVADAVAAAMQALKPDGAPDPDAAAPVPTVPNPCRCARCEGRDDRGEGVACLHTAHLLFEGRDDREEAAAAEADRRTPPPTPRPGGKRKAPVADPADRRAPDRLTDADVGRWVAESDDGRYRAHKLARIGGGGAAECACGESVDLRFAQLAAEGRRRCSKCEGP